jgi:tRNA-dihydrouridine synthase B
MDLYLAPMAGYTDSAFRLICREQGAKKLYTEMISSDGLVRKNQKTYAYLKTLEQDKPITVQLFGSDLDVILKSIEIVNKIEYFEGININCACPVKKVIKTGAGAALLKNTKNLEAIVKILKNNTKKESSIKIRLGYDKVILSELVKIAETYCLDYIIIHARTAKQMYSGKANWLEILKLKEKSKIKIVGNGDIKSKEDIFKYSSYCDSMMIGRAAIGNPFIFSCTINTNDTNNANNTNIELFNIILKHIEYNQKHYGVNYFINLKKHMVYYFKNFNLEKKLKNKYLELILKSENYNTFLKNIESFKENLLK